MLQFLAIFALVYLGTQMALKYFFPDQYGSEKSVTGVILEPADSTVKGQHHPVLLIKNKTEKDRALEDRCPMPPVHVWKVTENGEKTQLITQDTVLPCVSLTQVPAGETATADLAPWKYSLFDEYGIYEVELPVPEGTALQTADPGSASRSEVITRFTIYEPGILTQLFRTFVTKPLLNGFVFIASHTPDHNLGIAVILLTIVVKLLLFIPTQHAMEGQRKMQAVQPKMDALRAKYKDDPKKMQEETMKIWKEHKVNPMQSCLPLLVQFPILIGLFYTVRDGSILALSKHLLYAPYQHLTWSFGTQFLGMDLLVPNIYVMPILLVALQFAQMKLSFAISDRKKEKSASAKASADKQEKNDAPMTQQEIQQRVMMYGLPLMIGFFAISFPAAVSLYWGVSTVFAILQQLYVNRKDF